MISKSLIKLVRSLEHKKYRIKEGLFVAEGAKTVSDLLERFTPQAIFVTDDYRGVPLCSSAHGECDHQGEGHIPIAGDHEGRPYSASASVIGGRPQGSPLHAEEQSVFNYTLVSHDELRKLSFLQHPQQVLALFRLPDRNVSLRSSIHDESDHHGEGNILLAGDHEGRPYNDSACPQRNSQLSTLNSQLSTFNSQLSTLNSPVLALDGIQDPGNMGTIIRTADWFGVRHIVCSEDTADAFSPKVVQASMGSLARVEVTYTDLPTYLSSLDESVNIYGTFLDGESIYNQHIGRHSVIVMGNEGRGISDAVARLVTRRITIPRNGEGKGPDSLNVAIATAVILSLSSQPLSPA